MADRFKTHGAFSWFELMTPDIEKAKKFYCELFGWHFQSMPMPESSGEYTVVTMGGEGVAGLMAPPPEAPETANRPQWGVFITVDNVDSAVEEAVQLGGQVYVPPRDIPGVGRFAVLADPQGACFSVMSYEDM